MDADDLVNVVERRSQDQRMREFFKERRGFAAPHDRPLSIQYDYGPFVSCAEAFRKAERLTGWLP